MDRRQHRRERPQYGQSGGRRNLRLPSGKHSASILWCGLSRTDISYTCAAEGKLSDLVRTPGLTQDDIKLLRILYGSSNKKIAPHYVGHTEDSGAGRWSDHSSRGINRFQRVLHESTSSAAPHLPWLSEDVLTDPCCAIVFTPESFKRYGPFARDRKETAVVGFAREAVINVLSDATVRGVRANVNMFDLVRCQQIISAGEVETLFKEAQRILIEDAVCFSVANT